ncbi:MAG: outer membrane beta-barrel protein [Bacteroidetes bacterium]|nr:outer membrane beta-barrel protein [Bacteroidota bacterium]
MKPWKLFFIILMLSTSASSAQTNRTVRGKVYDSSHLALQGATVLLYHNEAKDTLKTITGKDGQFVFNKVHLTSFHIRVTNVDMETVDQAFDFEDAKTDLNIGSITLVPSVKILQEVVIAPPPIVIKEDTVEFKADSFRVRPNSSVEDLLKKLPGLQVDKDGNITAQGKTVSKIKVNGKDFFGGDPKTASRELPAEIVDKVQVVDDYGDLAAISGIKEGDPDIVINLQLKKDKSQGVFGKASAGYGTDNRRQATLSANAFSDRTQLSLLGNLNNINQNLFDFTNDGSNRRGDGGGPMNTIRGSSGGDGGTSDTNADQNGVTDNKSIGLNFRTDFPNKKGSLYGNYSFSNRNTIITRSTSQQNLFDNGNTYINNRNNLSNNIGNNHRLNLNLEYQIDSFNYIKVRPNFNYSYADNMSNGDFDYTNAGFKTQEGYSGDTVSNKSPNFNAEISYNRRFVKKGRNLSVNINLGTSSPYSEDDKINYTKAYLRAGGYSETFIDQLIRQDNNNHNYGVNIRYSEPVARNRFLDISYGYNTSYSKNDRKIFDRDGVNENLIFNDSLSNAYENTFINQRVGLSLRTINKKYNYSFGVTMQPVYMDGYSITKDSAYTAQKRLNFSPAARLSYNFSRSKRLNINYNASYNQPGFNQLQPVKDISNPQYQTQGNPNLKPEFSHNFRAFFNNFNFTSGRVMFVGMMANLVQNRIVNNNIRLDSSGAQLSVPENINGYYNVSGFYNYSIPFQNRTYVISFNGNVNYNHDAGLVDSKKNIGNNWVTTQRLNLELNLKEWLQLTTGGAYSLNSTKYNLTQNGARISSNAWAITNTARIDIPGGVIVRYDLSYTINQGLADNVKTNPTLFNASVEKTFFKNKNGFLRLSGFDIFNQNTSVTRQVSGNAIIDNRVNRITRYFMLTFTYKLTKFKGQQPSNQSENRYRREGRMF